MRLAVGSGVGAADRQRPAELFVGGEGLARRPVDVLATRLHDAAQALAHVRRVKTPPLQGWCGAYFCPVSTLDG